jgi:hypothetical protein
VVSCGSEQVVQLSFLQLEMPAKKMGTAKSTMATACLIFAFLFCTKE